MSSVILREIAELSNPAPRDFDPEDIAPDLESSDSEEGEDQDTGREHYVSVRFISW
jgi:protein AATF/BFR2